MALEEYLVSRLEQLANEREETIKSIEIIREKLVQADGKRVGQDHDENYLKWSQVYKTLDAQLTKMHAHLTSIDAETEEKKKKLAECQEKSAAEARKRAERLKFILDMPPEQFASLSIEDMQLLQEYEAGRISLSVEETGVSSAETVGISSEKADIEPVETPAIENGEAKAPPPETGKKPSPGPSREQPPHVRALQKIASGDTGSVTLREAAALADLDAALAGAPQDDPAVARSRAAVTAALQRVREECCRLQAKIGAPRPTTDS